MRISELSHAAAVPVTTIRYYERDGILPAPERDPNGYRVYSSDDVRTLRYLRRGQELGFTLDELTALSRLSAATRDGTLGRDVTEQARAKLDEIDARIADLARTRAAIADLLDAQCLDPDAACPIVDAIAGPTPVTAPTPA